MNLNKITKYLLQSTVLGLAIYYILFYTFIGMMILRYPFELEWLEGSVFQHVIRALSGKQIYVAPSLEFTPLIYNPLYYYVSAGMTLITGLNLFSLRLVSWLSYIGTAILVFIWIKKETTSKYWAVITTGIFAASVPLTGMFISMARVDSLFVFLLLSAVYKIRWLFHKKDALLAGFLFFMAYFTKQQAFLVYIFTLFYIFLKKRNFIFPFLTASALPMVGITVLLNKWTQGWFLYYTWYLPLHHKKVNEMIYLFWTNDILPRFSICLLFTIILFMFLKEKEKFYFYFFTFVGMTLTAWASRIHSGGAINVLLPIYTFLSITSILGISIFKSFLNHLEKKEILISLCILIQSCALWFNPSHFIIPQTQIFAGYYYLGQIKEISHSKNVYFSGTCYIPYLINKKSYTHIWTLWDVIRAKPQSHIAQQLLNHFKEKVQSQDMFIFAFSNYPLEKFLELVKLKDKYTIQKFTPPSVGRWPRFLYIPKGDEILKSDAL